LYTNFYSSEESAMDIEAVKGLMEEEGRKIAYALGNMFGSLERQAREIIEGFDSKASEPESESEIKNVTPKVTSTGVDSKPAPVQPKKVEAQTTATKPATTSSSATAPDATKTKKSTSTPTSASTPTPTPTPTPASASKPPENIIGNRTQSTQSAKPGTTSLSAPAVVNIATDKPNADWTKAQLRDYCKNKNITIGDTWPKPRILSAITNQQNTKM
jgi:hypothetical protein